MRDLQVVCAWRESVTAQGGQRTRGMRLLVRHNLLESIANPGLIPSVFERLIVEPLESLFVERSLGVIQAEGDLKVLRVCAESSLALKPSSAAQEQP